MNSGDAISGADDVPGDSPMEEDAVTNAATDAVVDAVVDEKSEASDALAPETKAAPQQSPGEVEAMIAGKVRSLSKPRSG